MTERQRLRLATILNDVLHICRHVEQVRHESGAVVTAWRLDLIDADVEVLGLLHGRMVLEYLIRVVTVALHLAKAKRTHHHVVTISLRKLRLLNASHSLV